MKVIRTLLMVSVLLIALEGKSQQQVIAKNDKAVPVKFAAALPNEEKKIFSVYPVVIKNTARVTIEADHDEWAVLEIQDAEGEVVLEQQMAVVRGSNSIPVFFISKLEKGAYTMALKMEDKVYSSKVVKE